MDDEPCAGGVLVVGLPDGGLLAYCSLEQAWSKHLSDTLALEDAPTLEREHTADCRPVRRTLD